MNKVFIGMGTCGLATGAGQVKTAVEKWAATRAMKVEIIPTGCIGYCKAEPIMDVVTDSGHRISYSNVTPDVAGFILDEAFVRKNYKLDGLLGQFRNGKDPLPGIPMIEEHPFFSKQVKYVLRNCGVIDPESISDYRASGGFKGFDRALSMSQAEVIQEITKSGLRGRGGSGFLTGKKWELALREKNAKKYVICNADEGDPGASWTARSWKGMSTPSWRA